MVGGGARASCLLANQVSSRLEEWRKHTRKGDRGQAFNTSFHVAWSGMWLDVQTVSRAGAEAKSQSLKQCAGVFEDRVFCHCLVQQTGNGTLVIMLQALANKKECLQQSACDI